MVQPWGTTATMKNGGHPDAEYALEVASWTLYHLTGGRYPGISTSTETYRLPGEPCTPLRSPQRSELRLRHRPVIALLDVADGDNGDYRVDRSSTLRRVDRRPLPLTRGLTVTYRHGVAPPAAGRRAATRLADEVLLSMSDSDECRLPDRVTSISRQNVSYTVLDPQDFLRDGRTGLYEVDLFISTANPSRAKVRARVFSPDDPEWTR